MSHPRPPLHGAKLRRTRLMLVMATVVLVCGTAVEVASGRGVWVTGLLGWAAIVVAVVLGAGGDNAAAIIGLADRVERWRDEHGDGIDDRPDLRPTGPDGPRNEADWS